MDRRILLRREKSRFVKKQRGRRVIDWETELMAAFETVVQRDFPNPQRIGCPGHDSLVALVAGRSDAESALALAHIRECAPCFDELKQLRATDKR